MSASTRCSARPRAIPKPGSSRSTWTSRHRSRRCWKTPSCASPAALRPRPGCENLCLGRRRCAQLRRQRQGAARRPLSQDLDAAGGGRCRRCARARRLPPTTSMQAANACCRTRSTAWQGAYLGPEFDQPDIEKRLDGRRRAFCDRGARRHARYDRQGAGGRPGGGLVPGSHGIRAPRARQPLDPRRPAQPDHAEEPQPQGQIPRELPALCPIGAARGSGELVRPRRRQSLHAAGRSGGRSSTCGT